ncbi:MAG TPA: Flp family type IVb pilin [Pseudolabrys sp.]|jgi:pilus assembly protein Flp/PilA
MSARIRNFIKDENGATAIEYALLASGIGIAILATVNTLGSNVNAMWTTVATALR